MNASLENLRGIGRLSTDAVVGVVDLVEAMHRTLSPAQALLGQPGEEHTRGIAAVVYKSIRGISRLSGGALDAALGAASSLLALIPDASATRSPLQEAARSVVNGVLGDHLVDSANPLAITMRLYAHAGDIPSPPGDKLAVFVHGLCLDDLHWQAQDCDYGAALARDLGYTPLYLHYNSGRHISVNGREFAEQLESLMQARRAPLKELVLIGHSMGGLVIRSACHHGALAGHAWRRQAGKAFFLGTPHHGAPLERNGAWIDALLGSNAIVAPFARLGKIRSAGITDLRHGNLVDADWQGRDRSSRADTRVATPLPDDVACHAIAATTGSRAGSLADRLLGDGLVPLASALGQHADAQRALRFSPSRQWIGYRMNHMNLLGRVEVYERIRQWLETPDQVKASKKL
ncbi:hypothetical protein [Rudaea sp.]|uniref:esterase/lipase family protein n=1 Tax=Rudaea sp. TaxID=2136325 RepID=UPI002ED63B02